MKNGNNKKCCPKCGKENPEGARFCCSCGCALMQVEAKGQTISVKVSKMALVAFASALCSLVLLIPIIIAVIQSHLRQTSMSLYALPIGVVILAVTVVLGIVSVIRIERSGGRITGRAFSIGAILIGVIGSLVFPAWIVVGARTRSTAFHLACATNLMGLGNAILIYANDYEDKLPKAGGKSSVWAAKIPNWKAYNRFDAYSMRPDGSGGKGSISSSLYLLVKYADVPPKKFVCTNDYGIKEFKHGWIQSHDKELTELWDFGPEPQKNCSYSYNVPYGGYPLTTSCDRRLAVAADRNPWMDSPFKKARDFKAFNPDGSKEEIRAGNAIAHKAEYQNVLFLDCHVGQEKHSFCGLNEDNIYTYWNGEDIRRGTPPKLGSKPADRADSLLVNDPAIPP